MSASRKLFIRTEGNDDVAYNEAIGFAVSEAKRNKTLYNIVLVANTLKATGWLDRLYGIKEVKKMKNGISLGNSVMLKVESIQSLKKGVIPEHSIVITMGIDDKGVYEIDEEMNDGILITIPWTIKGLKGWLSANNPIDLRTGQPYTVATVELDSIVKAALDMLSGSINLSSGLTHPQDEELAKTYIRALFRYKSDQLDEDAILGYLTTENKWKYENANQFIEYIKKLKSHMSFHSGISDEKTHKQLFGLWDGTETN
ncbi:MAG: hypothetical protein EHM58_15250 [Ignavibacteriae bacterium]|nr:MAG: hypothetical protein EHM58_15250 [Ignavibacteriota bacterium]